MHLSCQIAAEEASCAPSMFRGCGPYVFAPENLSKGACISQQEHTVSFSRWLAVSRLLDLSVVADGWQLLCRLATHSKQGTVATTSACTSIQGSDPTQPCCSS